MNEYKKDICGYFDVCQSYEPKHCDTQGSDEIYPTCLKPYTNDKIYSHSEMVDLCDEARKQVFSDEKSKEIEKKFIGVVVLMAQQSMCPDNYKKFCESMTYMTENRSIDLSDVL